MARYTAAHWGIYEIGAAASGGPFLTPFAADPDPSPIGLSALEATRSAVRVQRPAVRRSWMESGWGARPDLRGLEPFVEVPWKTALDLAATALADVIARRGNGSIFGGSYGWSSAGRFHHAPGQVHRFLNCIGGYVRHADSYSLGAARVLMPHVIDTMDRLVAMHTSWDVLAEHTRLFVSFGGVPAKNAQISQGMVGHHNVREGLQRMSRAGVRFVNVSPVDSNLDTGTAHEWVAIRPNTDAAMLLAIAHTLHVEHLSDAAFLASHCVGFETFLPYLLGRDDGVPKAPEWAAEITGVPAARIRSLARELAAVRSMVTISWALQRSHHGEQPFWALLTVACMLGQIGLPGGGFGVGYGATNGIGNVTPRFGGPTLPQGTNNVEAFIPVARIADMLEKPGGEFNYNGQALRYPDIELIYWAGGNPFHHHQDLNRLTSAWRKPRAVLVNEQFWTPAAKMADIVFPVTTTLERDDIGYAAPERYIVAMRRVIEPVGESRNDFEVFSELAGRLGQRDAFTQGRSTAEWVRFLYDDCLERASAMGVALPDFDAFWEQGLFDLAPLDKPHVMLADFRADPLAHPVRTPSGRIEIFSETIAAFGYADCAGHPRWYEPIEWLGSEKAARHPLHMLSDQPFTKLHSQLDHGSYSQGNKIGGREPVTMNRADAAARGIGEGDVVCIFNDRGRCLAGARLSDAIRPGVIKLSTGAWYDPVSREGDRPLEKHGNPNTLTLDIGASQLSQGCIAQTCLVEVERFQGSAPPVTAYELPTFVEAGGSG